MHDNRDAEDRHLEELIERPAGIDITLHDRLAQCGSSNPHFDKDLAKARHATKYIGRGSPPSSTERYRIAAGDLANCGVYHADDIVFISAEGNRSGRYDPDTEEIMRAAKARVRFVTDHARDRMRPYNIGERQVADLLHRLNYWEIAPGQWDPSRRLL